MTTYELRLLEADGRTVALYALNCLNDERAKESIFSVTSEPYARYEIWRGMAKISEGARFICGDRPTVPLERSTVMQ
jgi:hypothetical protein